MSIQPSLQQWKQQTVWIMGASSGIGHATAELLLRKGATVYISARHHEPLDALAQQYNNAIALPVDVCDTAGLAKAYQTIAEAGPLDLYLHCAADYVTYSDTKNEWTARTSDNKRAASVLSVDGALVALLDEVYGVDPKQACLHETTDDEMRELGKRRYSILHFPVVEKAPEAITVPPVTAPTPAANPNNTPPSYDELVLAINHASTVNQAAALVGRISKHSNFSQQQSLYALQRKRVDALKAAEQST